MEIEDVRGREGRWQRLRASTHEAHEQLDKAIMASEPFADRDRYGCFLRMQYILYRDVDALYLDPVLGGLLPDLADRRRLGLIEKDFEDLGLALPSPEKAPLFGASADVPRAAGWLYVVEGSNLGAAFLLKGVAKIGLSENNGARHLAGHPDGRGLHWRRFTAAIDGLEFGEVEDERMLQGADEAFARVREIAQEVFA